MFCCFVVVVVLVLVLVLVFVVVVVVVDVVGVVVVDRHSVNWAVVFVFVGIRNFFKTDSQTKLTLKLCHGCIPSFHLYQTFEAVSPAFLGFLSFALFIPPAQHGCIPSFHLSNL